MVSPASPSRAVWVSVRNTPWTAPVTTIPTAALRRPFPFPDALQEFNVETSGLNARSGGQGSGMINSVTKSGTNEIHGNGFWFLRDDALCTPSPMAPSRTKR